MRPSYPIDPFAPYSMPYMAPPMMQPMHPPPRPQPAYMQPPPQLPPSDLPTDKDALGEQLYAKIEAVNPGNAAKITGMLLEMEVAQIQAMLRDQTQLDKWITEALKVTLFLTHM